MTPRRSIARILHENQWASVKRQPDSPDDGPQITVAPLTSAAIGFVRELPRVSVKTLDLVDVVAGGDGFSGRRDRGIDPTSGRPIDTAPQIATIRRSATSATGNTIAWKG